MTAIYIHIPFCKKICNYCDFCKMLYQDKYIYKYLESLEKEINTRYKNEEVSSIYIGGGTPSCLDISTLQRLFRITSIFNKSTTTEFTIECNPEDITIDKVKLFAASGVNRISLGVQTFDKDNIKYLGRSHSYKTVKDAIKLLKLYNLTNINIDLIYAIDENINIVKKDLQKYLKLKIPHLSYYSLIIEPNTILSLQNKKYINEDIELKMYKLIEKRLVRHHYKHYEISNYAKKGYESVHNLTYWQNNDYYGFGLSAVSYINNTRIINTKNLSKYLQNNYVYDIIKENLQDRIDNEIMLSLRTSKGLNLEKFYQKYHHHFQDLYDIKYLLDNKYLEIERESIKINKKYLYISNEIILKIEESRKENASIN